VLSQRAAIRLAAALLDQGSNASSNRGKKKPSPALPERAAQPPSRAVLSATMHEPTRFACHAAATDMKNPRHGAAAPCAGVREKRGAGGLNASHAQSKAAEGVRSVAALRNSCGKVVQARLTPYERLRAPRILGERRGWPACPLLVAATARRPCPGRRGRRSAVLPSCRPALRPRGGQRSRARLATIFPPCS
jgi:hypothetical protein